METLIKLVQDNFGTGVASAIIIGALWFGSRIIKPGIAQADANAALYTQLNEQMTALREEVRLLKRQQVILERLALKAGIDVEQAYREAGLYDDK